MATETCAQCGSREGVRGLVYASDELEVALRLKGENPWRIVLCKSCWIQEHSKASADDLVDLLYDAISDRDEAEKKLENANNNLQEAQNDATSFYSDLQALQSSNSQKTPQDTQDALKVVEEIQTSSFSEGEEVGRQSGFKEGKEDGFTEGKEEGVSEGFDKGYDEGYQEGMKDAKKSQEAVHGC